jgi:hypothetical protein
VNLEAVGGDTNKDICGELADLSQGILSAKQTSEAAQKTVSNRNQS